MLNNFFSQNNNSLLYFVITVISLLIAYFGLLQILRRFGKNPKYLMPLEAVKKISRPILLIFLSILIRMETLRDLTNLEEYAYWFRKSSTLLFIFAFTWLLLSCIKIAKHHIMGKYDIHAEDNLQARKVTTQFNILERILIFIVIILAVGIALM
ncbi:MAG: mechanosensitive ion channel family protein, partial [Pricia sp.]|nr:mechanosensitive ion channel family protein [Pricia sp.]